MSPKPDKCSKFKDQSVTSGQEIMTAIRYIE